MKYNHYEYFRQIAAQLKGVNDFIDSIPSERVTDINTRLSKAQSPVLVAVDYEEDDLQINEAEMCLSDKTYTVLLLKKAIRPQYSEIHEATTVCGDLMRKVVARIMHDRAE